MSVPSHEDQFTFLKISSRILLRMTNISGKRVEKIKTYISGSTTFFFFENRAICEIKWRNIVEPEGHMAVQYLR